MSVPELLVFDLGRGKFGHALETDGEVPEIGDGRVSVLEVKALQKLPGIVRANPVNRIPNRIRRSAITRQGVSKLLGRHRGERQNATHAEGPLSPTGSLGELSSLHSVS